MKFVFAAFLVLLLWYQAEGNPVVRGIAPNHAAPGSMLTVRMVVEDASTVPDVNDLFFGKSIQVRSIVQHQFEQRHERRLLFLQAQLFVEPSAEDGPRSVGVGNSSPASTAVFYVQSDAAMMFRAFKRIESNVIPFRLLAANLDSDKYEELVSVNLSPFTEGNISSIQPFEDKIQTFYATKDGSVVSAREAVLSNNNRDGFMDLSILNWVQFDVVGGILVRANNAGDGTFTVASGRQSKIADLFIASGDFNGDHFDDLALVGYTGEVMVLPGGGLPQFRFKTIPRAFHGEIHNMIAADINRDGFDDLVFPIDNEAGHKKEFGLVFAKPDGAFEPLRRVSLPFPEEGPWLLAISDLNNDGKIDFVFTSNGNRELIVSSYSNGKFEFRPPIMVECNALAVADIDADSDSDIVCAGSDVDQISIFRTSGSTLLPRVTLVSPRYPVSVAVGDWNGDARPDLAAGFGKTYFPHLPDERNGLTFYLQFASQSP